MLQITKITNKNNKIEIHHSDSLVDKRTHYEIQFDSVYKGYRDYYINKEIVQSKSPRFSQLTCKMYLSTDKFRESPEKWIETFKDAYDRKYSGYKWYRELILK